MAITSVGTPTAATGTASPITASDGAANQNRVAGNVLIAVVTWTSTTSTTATAQNSGTTGWTNLIEIASAGTLARTSIWWKTATGGDAAPAFTSTLGTTNTSSCTIFDLSGANGYVVDTSGTVAASATLTTQTATTSGNVTLAGEFGIAGFARERASTASVVTASTYTLATSNTGVTSTGHFATMTLSSPGTGATSAATVNYSLSGTTAQGAGAVVVFGLALTGPTLAPLSQPPGVRAVLLRIGDAQATLLAPVAAVPPPPVTPAPLYPLTSPARSRIPQNIRGRVYGRPGAPVHNPTSGPPVRALPQPVHAPFPQPFSRGRAEALRGAPRNNPTAGPPVRAWQGPARARIPQPFSKGRAAGSRGSLATPPVPPGPAPFYALNHPARAVIPARTRALPPLSRPGAPVANPTSGVPYPSPPQPAGIRSIWLRAGHVQTSPAIAVTPPPPFVPATFYPLHQPARSRITPPPRGRVAGNPGAPVHNPAAPLYPLTSPVRGRIPQTFLVGRAATMAVLPLPSARGPKVYPLTGPVRARQPLPSRGRIFTTTPPVVVEAGAGQQVPLTQPMGARVSFLRTGHIQSTSTGAPVANPTHGPAFPARQAPAQARQPLPRRGRITGNQGAPVRNPVILAPLYPLTSPVRARIPQPFSKGRVSANPGLPPVQAGPAVRPLGRPVQAQRPLFLLGRAESRPGAPVHNPTSGPPVRPLTQPVQARQPLPRRGRTTASGTAKAVPPPPFVAAIVYPLTQPVAARRPLPAPGRAATMALLPPALQPATGPPFSLPAHPAQGRRPLPSRGRITVSPAVPVLTPPAPVTPPPAPPLHAPVRARLQPSHLNGRAATMAMLPFPQNPTAPVYPLTRPVQARRPLPPAGRAFAGSKGAPPPPPTIPARVYPLTQPVRARRPLPPAGRVYGITKPPPAVSAPVGQPPLSQPAGSRVSFLRAGHIRFSSATSAPVRNPTRGPKFTLPTQPAKARPPLPPAGRAFAGGRGAPVINPIPVHTLPPAIATVAPYGPLAATAVITPSGPLAAEATVEGYGPLAAKATVHGGPLS